MNRIAAWLALGLSAAQVLPAWAGTTFDSDTAPSTGRLIESLRAVSQGLGPVPPIGITVTVSYPCEPGRVYHGGPCDHQRLEVPRHGAYPPGYDDTRFPGPPSVYGDMRGYCPDPDHSEFKRAKSFAYSGSGLNLDDGPATRWAFDYLATHACGVLEEYKARYAELYAYGYSGSYRNLDSDGARRFAIENVEFTPVRLVKDWQAQFPRVKEFFYSGGYMNMDSRDASSRTDDWVRRSCGDIRPIMEVFKREYSFAYSGSGLNMTSHNAIRYAADRVAPMTPCYDLFR